MFYSHIVVNVAGHGHAEQYETYTDHSNREWSADKAIDNKLCRSSVDSSTDPDVDLCCSCSLVKNDAVEKSHNFWKLSFSRQYEVERLKLYARNGKSLQNDILYMFVLLSYKSYCRNHFYLIHSLPYWAWSFKIIIFKLRQVFLSTPEWILCKSNMVTAY